MKVKRKKGSTFVIVIVVMGIIFTTGTTILAVTANDYKMRINQSKKLQNLYEADSGLDVVENIIIKTSQEAIKYADKEAKREFANLNEGSRDKKKLNKIFEEKFFQILRQEKLLDPELAKELGLELGNNVELLYYLIVTKQYIILNDEGKIEYKEALAINNKLNNESISKERFKINIDEYEFKDNRIHITVTSTFQNIEGQLKNEKKISTKFTLSAPEYNPEITSINIYPVFDGKAITADGNMNVTDGNTNISGDIWIQGNNNLGEKPEYTFDKYIGGIKLDNTSFNIDGNIYTNNTLHLSDKVESNVKGETFAKNVYVGNSVNSNGSKLNNITFEKNLIVNNDLALNATDSSILIKNNFYGINEKTTEIETAEKALHSSSIIVNDTSDTSKITVNEKSYIMGVAYLNATDNDGKKYQTGESVAVKGNYLAYTDVDKTLIENGIVTLRYYSPLQLLESKDRESNATKKAEYFSEYYSNDKNDYKFNDGGVNLKGEVKSVGTSIKDKDGEIQKSNISDSDLTLVNNQRNEFARNVFAMGDITGLKDFSYENQKVRRTVADEIYFNKVKDENIVSENGVVILRGTNSNIEIVNGFIGEQKIEKGLIITNGDITIEGNFDFTGNIITTGNIILKGSGEKKITYDPQVIRNILAENHDLLKDIFVGAGVDRQEVKVTSASELYTVDKFLSKSLWKIVK